MRPRKNLRNIVPVLGVLSVFVLPMAVGHAQTAPSTGDIVEKLAVEAEADQVDEVVAGERLVEEVGVDEPEGAEAAGGGAEAADVREHQLGGVADDDVVDLARAMHEGADLPALKGRNFRIGHRLGGRPFLYGLCAADLRLHLDHV